MKVGVIGAGCVGLSTAINIQEVLPGASVRIMADLFNTETLSAGAGGLFVPTQSSHKDTPEASLRRWATASFQEYSRLVQGPEAGQCGAMVSHGYVLSKRQTYPLYKDVVFSCNHLAQEERDKLEFVPKDRFCLRTSTILLDQKFYLPWLMKRFKHNGGVVESRTIKNMEELVGKFDVVVNCGGLRGGELVRDPDIRPRRGHVIRVKAPWIKHFFVGGPETYIIPRRDHVVLGVLRQDGRSETEVNPEDSKQIMERCSKLVPSLKDAQVLEEWVGLRPQRDQIRVEPEVMTFPSGKLKVVHNYGHGSSGIALSWGTGREAAELTRDFLRKQPKAKL